MFKNGLLKVTKSIYIKVMLFTLLFTLVVTGKCYAQNVGRFAESITINGTNEMVLNDEEVQIDVTSGNVTCNYEIYNTKDEKVRAKILFPVKSDYPFEINFNAYVNDEFVLANVIDSNTSEYNYYYTFEALFEPKKNTNIKITYDALWKFNDDYSIVVGYNKNNGTIYKENIKHTKISFDFGELLKYYVVSPNDNSTYKKVGTKYVWEATNYTSNENISLLMRPKLITSNTNNLSYYDSKNSLKNVRVLIDVDSLYTKKEEEKKAVLDAADYLKLKLEELGCECALSNDVEALEKKIKKEAKFDYVITLICKQAQDPSIMTKEIYVEPFKKGKESKYVKSDIFATYVRNAGTSGVCEYFNNLTSNGVIGNNNVLKYIGSLDVSECKIDAPRIIVSLGYITDKEKVYESFQGIMEKTRLGLVIMNESEIKEENNKQVVVTKNNYKVTQGKKNFFQKVGTKISKFFKYNIVTIISSIMIGIGLAILRFVVISNHFEKKMQISYEEIKKREKALEEKLALIEKTKEENEKHKETLKEILRERLKKLTERKNKQEENFEEEIIKLNNPKEEKENSDVSLIVEEPSEFVEVTHKKEDEFSDITISEESFVNHKQSEDKKEISDTKEKTKKEKVKKEKKPHDNKIINLFKKIILEIKIKFAERKLNKFEKISKGEANKILRKVNSKNISK